MTKTGILGGTFNPIHISHLMIAKTAKEDLGLDRVLVMPSKRPPHKENKGIASDAQRLEMTGMAIRDLEGFELSTLETERESEYTYTSDTLKELKSIYPDDRFYFIIGGDSLEYFHTWHEPEVILRNCVLVATGRASVDGSRIKGRIRELTRQFSDDGFVPEIIYVQPPQMDVSSYLIRKLISYDMPATGMLHREVERYIADNGLYLSEQFEAIKKSLEQKLKPSRYEHTLNVAKTAARLALIHGVDSDKAYLAGLLHDCAKYMDDETMLAEGEAKCPDLDEFDRGSIQLIHAKLGAVYAREQYGIDDTDILNSIRYHTTGRPDMSRLEEIIYIADYIEPGRSREDKARQQELELARSMATYDIKGTMRFILKCTYDYLNSPLNRYPISPMTLKAYDFYEKIK
ncbi:MAG: nicotinate-nucleotide adenylyltransferase [Lachnospiraceae bacterium]|nr:nicotinate-nucleotide adenylyltransferase [Lachnospiraceae bacterium]